MIKSSKHRMMVESRPICLDPFLPGQSSAAFQPYLIWAAFSWNYMEYIILFDLLSLATDSLNFMLRLINVVSVGCRNPPALEILSGLFYSPLISLIFLHRHKFLLSLKQMFSRCTSRPRFNRRISWLNLRVLLFYVLSWSPILDTSQHRFVNTYHDRFHLLLSFVGHERTSNRLVNLCFIIIVRAIIQLLVLIMYLSSMYVFSYENYILRW